MSSKVVSYYDWSLGFKKNLSEKKDGNRSISNHVNSIGLSEDNFKEFLKNWKENNL